MPNASVEDEVLALEKSYWQAMKDRDTETMLRLTDDPCIVAGAQGVMKFDAAEFRKVMEKPECMLHDFDMSGAQVRLLTPDVAVVAYRVHERLTVDGKPLSLDAADASTWVRRGGRWVCAMHTESILGDGFGRDRK